LECFKKERKNEKPKKQNNGDGAVWRYTTKNKKIQRNREALSEVTTYYKQEEWMLCFFF